jgi:hypothetical protein
MAYKNTYAFLKNVLKKEDVTTMNSEKMYGGGCKKKKTVSYEEYSELAATVDKLLNRIDYLESMIQKRRVNLKGGDDYEYTGEIEEIYIKQNYSDDDVNYDDVKTILLKSKKKESDKSKFTRKYEEEYTVGTPKTLSESSSDSSVDEDDSNVTGYMTGGEDANKILEELGEFEANYFKASKNSAPALKGGYKISHNSFSEYPY